MKGLIKLITVIGGFGLLANWLRSAQKKRALRVKSRPVFDGIYAESGPFSIGIVEGLRVTRPIGGATWDYYSPQTIMWEYSGTPGRYVDITLHQGGSGRVIAENVPIGDGRYGSYNLRQVPELSAARDYYIKVRPRVGNVEAYGGPFTIGTPEGMRVTKPRSGDIWAYYSPQTIIWEYSGRPGREVAIILIRRSTNAVRTLADNVPIGSGGSGSYNLTGVPVVPAANDYVIRVQVSR